MKKEIKTCLFVMAVVLSGAASLIIAKPNRPCNPEVIYHGNHVPIPKLLTLEVMKNGDKVTAFWTAGKEYGTNCYTLERSKNGADFEIVSTIYAVNTLSNIVQFIETDFSPLKGISYYRLKETDSKNNKVYSNIVMINYTIDKSGGNFGIRKQNNEEVINSLNGLSSFEAIVTLRDVKGMEFYSKLMISLDNSYIIGYDAENKLIPGTYLITGASNNMLFGQNLIIRQFIY